MRVFISYKRQDVEFARQLYQFIDSCGLEPWLDVVHIQPGSAWDTEIHKGLRDSQMVVGVLTPESLASENVLDEWGYALSTQKRLLLIWLRDVDEADIPHRYIRLQRIDMRHTPEEGFKRLEKALESPAKLLALEEPPPAMGFSVPPEPDLDIDLPTPAATPLLQRSNRSRMLEKVRTFWVDGVLKQSVHGVALLELGLQDRAEAVRDPWDTVLQHVAYGDYRLPPGTHIDEIYRALDGELLILGDPGSGKTTTLLELARDRIALAEHDGSQPIPVVFNLSSWADDRKPLHEWLASELNTKYGVPRKVAKMWVEQDELLLLLDGLDEVLLRYRDQCVQAINEFRQEHGFAHMVVCSRITDYEALSTRLNLHGAIVIQPLSEEQVDLYLRSLGADYEGVREAMTLDPGLHKLAETPLMLSVMTLAFRGIPAIDLPPLSTLEAQRRRLFAIYTQRMFERRAPQRFTTPDIMHYLKWLAGRMVERKQSVFYIENLQMDWIAGDFPQRLYRIVGRTAFGIVGGALLGAVGSLGLLISAILLGLFSLNESSTPRFIAAVVFLAVGIPAGLGGLLFALSGLQAYALATLVDTPETIEPEMIRHLIKRIINVIVTGMGLGLLCALIVAVGAIIVFLCTGISIDSLSFYNTYANAAIYGWSVIPYISAILLLVSLSAGAYAGAACAAVACVVYGIWEDRRFMLGMVGLAIFGLGVVLTLPLLMFVTQLIQLFPVSWAAGLSFWGPLIGTPLVSAPFLAFLAYLIPRRIQTTPYILLGEGFVIWFTVVVILSDISTRGRFLFQPQFNGVLIVLVLTAVCGLMGVLVGAINDYIESAETLRWRWNWRWASIGLLGALGMVGLMITRPVSDQQDYLVYYEDKANEQIADYKLYLENIKVSQTEWQAVWNGYKANDDNFDVLEAAITDIARLEAQLDRDETGRLYSISDKLITAKCGLPNDLGNYYYSSTYNYPYSPSFINVYLLSNKQIEDYTKQLDALKTQIPEGTDASQWVQTRTNMLFCDWQAARLNGMIRYQYLHYTEAGIQEQFISVFRVAFVLGIAFIVTGGVVAGLRKSETIDIRTRPNQGIRRTLQSAARITLAFGLVGLIVGGLVGFLLTTLPEGDVSGADSLLKGLVPLGMVLGICIGISLGLLMGGSDAVVKHIILRLFLQRSRSIPRNYAALLDEAASLILLRKVGGGYIFIHRYLLEYYAGLENKEDEAEW